MKTIDEYISSFPEEKRVTLQKIRHIIKKAVPEAEEAMGYGVPAFKLRGKYLIYYAAFKNHIGLLSNTGSYCRLSRRALQIQAKQGNGSISIG
ncbi:MAG: DUF1801 domain-containing protein [Patescibacteria group bacterium]